VDVLWRVTLVGVGFPLLCVCGGWCLLARVPDLDREERFAAAGLLGAACVAAVAFLTFLTGWPPLLIGGAILWLATVIALAGGGGPPRAAAGPAALWPVAGMSALGYLHLLAIQALLPQYVGGQWLGDWQHHYLGARVFAGLEPVDTQWGGAGTYTVASRTPLFNLAAAGVMGLAGPEFCIYQMAATFLNVTFLPVIYLLLRDFFGRPAARLGLLLAPLNLWLLHIAWFTWPKMLAAAFVLLGLHFYLRSLRVRHTDPAGARRLFLSCWVSCVLGYLTHQVAAVYLLVLASHAVLLAWRERRFRLSWRAAALLTLTAVLPLATWYGWLLSRFGSWATVNSTPTTQMDPQFAEAHGFAKVSYVLVSVLLNISASVEPSGLSAFYLHWQGPWTAAVYYCLATDFYFNLLTGAITVSLCLYLLGRLARAGVWAAPCRARMVLGQPEWSAVWAFALLGGAGAAALHPLRSANGVAHSALFPTAVLLLVLAWGVLSRARRLTRVIVCGGMVAEFLLMFWSHVAVMDSLLFDAYNPAIKAEGLLLFLNDRVGPAAIGFVAAVQVVLVALLATEIVRPSPSAEPSSDYVG
jgi:hypothetical protein